MTEKRILLLDRGDELFEQLERVVDGLDGAPELAVCSQIGSVGEVLEEDGPFDVLVAGTSLASASGLTRLQIIAEALPGMQVVLAFGQRPDATLRDIIRTGAVDLVQLPIDDDDLADALERALRMAERPEPEVIVKEVVREVVRDAPAPVIPVAAAPAVPAPAAGVPLLGTVMTIASATGGCGKTFYSTNLAWFLQNWTGRRVCIVDLDLQFGEVSTALRLRPKYTIFDALQREEDVDEEVLVQHIEEYTVVHDTGVHVLAAPREPSEADRISPPDVTRILRAVRRTFDFVIVDTPPALAETVLAAFDVSDQLYVLATLDLPSVRNLSVFLSTLDRLKISTDNVRLILNKAERDIGIDIDQVIKLFDQGFESVLPYAKEVSRSINLGMPVMAASPDAEISRLMAGGMLTLLPADRRAEVESQLNPRRSGLRSRLFGK